MKQSRDKNKHKNGRKDTAELSFIGKTIPDIFVSRSKVHSATELMSAALVSQLDEYIVHSIDATHFRSHSENINGINTSSSAK